MQAIDALGQLEGLRREMAELELENMKLKEDLASTAEARAREDREGDELLHREVAVVRAEVQAEMLAAVMTVLQASRLSEKEKAGALQKVGAITCRGSNFQS